MVLASLRKSCQEPFAMLLCGTVNRSFALEIDVEAPSCYFISSFVRFFQPMSWNSFRIASTSGKGAANTTWCDSRAGRREGERSTWSVTVPAKDLKVQHVISWAKLAEWNPWFIMRIKARGDDTPRMTCRQNPINSFGQQPFPSVHATVMGTAENTSQEARLRTNFAHHNTAFAPTWNQVLTNFKLRELGPHAQQRWRRLLKTKHLGHAISMKRWHALK